MFGVCPHCGIFGRDKKSVDPASSELICDECGGRTPFLRQPLFFVTGPSGAGKSEVAWTLMGRQPTKFVPLEQDILWGVPFAEGQGDYLANFCELWMWLTLNIGQSGTPVVLCGTARPEQYENLLDRKFFGRTHYLALVCDDDELRQRLEARPAWRRCDAEFMDNMVNFNHWFKENASKTFPPMTLLETTGRSVEETSDEVETWIHESLKSTEGHREYRKWLEERHEDLKTSDNVIDEMVRKASGSRLATKTRLLLGEMNEVYAVETEDSQELIVRIAHEDNPRFQAELVGLRKMQRVRCPRS